MKPKMLTFTLAMLAFALTACQPAAPGALPRGQAVLGLGESIASADGNLGVTFIEVAQDSRCPADAVCVTSGSVRVLVQVTLGTESFQPTLTLGDLLAGDVASIQVANSTITLVDVQPYPLASQLTDPRDYEITVNIRSN
jgi:hypothetical protein